MAEIARMDINQRIGDTLGQTFQFRQTDGTLRSFASSVVVFHAQSGDTTIHYQSGTDPEVLIIDGTETSAGPGGVDCAVLVKVPFSVTETWYDTQTFFYEIEEWISGERYTLIDGNIVASAGVVDSDD
jgi:hypothetical protein